MAYKTPPILLFYPSYTDIWGEKHTNSMEKYHFYASEVTHPQTRARKEENLHEYINVVLKSNKYKNVNKSI